MYVFSMKLATAQSFEVILSKPSRIPSNSSVTTLSCKRLVREQQFDTAMWKLDACLVLKLTASRNRYELFI
jgi:hypothetical protein